MHSFGLGDRQGHVSATRQPQPAIIWHTSDISTIISKQAKGKTCILSDIHAYKYGRSSNRIIGELLLEHRKGTHRYRYRYQYVLGAYLVHVVHM